MKAVVITRPGGPEVLEVREIERPEPGPEQVRVRVRATALNRADLLQREGRYPSPPGVRPDVPGMEFAGEIDAVGSGVDASRVGRRVFGIVAGASYAEYVVTHARAAIDVPAALGDTEAAAVPEAFITAHDALFSLGRLRAGHRVLIHAVGSGVALAATQLASAAQAEVFGTARTRSKLERARAFGVHHALDAEGFAERANELTAQRGVHLVLDFIGGPYLAPNLQVLAERGRLIVLGLLGGARETTDLGLVLRKRLSVTGTVLRPRPLEEKLAASQAFAAEVVPLLARGVVRPVIDCVMPIEQVRQAHEHMAANANFGKIVLTL